MCLPNCAGRAHGLVTTRSQLRFQRGFGHRGRNLTAHAINHRLGGAGRFLHGGDVGCEGRSLGTGDGQAGHLAVFDVRPRGGDRVKSQADVACQHGVDHARAALEALPWRALVAIKQQWQHYNQIEPAEINH